jgi:hypothetical protein
MLKYYIGEGGQLFADFCFSWEGGLGTYLREKRGMIVVDTNKCIRYFNGRGTGI